MEKGRCEFSIVSRGFYSQKSKLIVSSCVRAFWQGFGDIYTNHPIFALPLITAHPQLTRVTGAARLLGLFPLKKKVYFFTQFGSLGNLGVIFA